MTLRQYMKERERFMQRHPTRFAAEQKRAAQIVHRLIELRKMKDKNA